jgi:hypothetical protein
VKANSTGRVAEDVLAEVLRSIGLQFDRQVVIGTTIYGGELRVDFVVHNFTRFPLGLAVESKWQDVGGSVDEKFPYLVANIRQRYHIPAVVIAHGGGHRGGALEWLRACCDDRLVGVYTLEQFISWANRLRATEVLHATHP